MKIVLATGIFTPEIGGPATYVPALAKEFVRLGIDVSVITYSDVDSFESDSELPFQVIRIKRKNKISNYLRYFFALKKLSKESDVMYSFDHFSAGIPATLVSLISKVPLFIRIGGDFIWERYLQNTDHAISLREYYEQGIQKTDNIRFSIIKWVFNNAKGLIFTTDFQANIFSTYYKFSKEKIHIILNPLPSVPKDLHHEKKNNEIVFAGRLNGKNNVMRLVQAFEKLQTNDYVLRIIGEGEKKEELEDYVKNSQLKNVTFQDKVERAVLWNIFSECHAAIFPSLTDISPNTMLDCVAIGTPFITSKEIGYDWVLDIAHSFDPSSVEDVAEEIAFVIHMDTYQSYKEKLSTISYSKNFLTAAEETQKIFESSV